MTSRMKINTAAMVVLALALNVCWGGSVLAGQFGGTPASSQHNVSALSAIPVLATDILDVPALLQEDVLRQEQGLPYRYALPQDVHLSPETDGRWETLPDGSRIWRLRVANPGALSLNLGFTSYDLPYGAELFIYAADESGSVLVFDAEDNRTHQELWTPILFSDEVVVELVVPAGKAITEANLTLGVVGRGYVEFGRQLDKAGFCNIDVVCPQGDEWREEIRAEAVYSTGGSTFCSGSMINNTGQDGSPFFLTAHHCEITSVAAPSVVVYWNYQSPNCGDLGGGTLDQFTNGSTLRATYSTSDMTLIELDALPDPAFGVTYAGWDRTSANPPSAVAIHSPGADEKCISFENDPLETTSYLQHDIPGNGTHLRVEYWDLGTTEPGSSGSPLFNPDHRIVGQLHGGYASCTLDTADWYGRLSVSWEGGGTSDTRLSDWLDPLNTGTTIMNTYDPAVTGLNVLPLTVFSSSGDAGGPFAPSAQVYTLRNMGNDAFSFSASTFSDWLSITPSSGTIPGGETALVTASISAAADTMAKGYYEGTVEFTNTTTGEGNAVRHAELTVGQREIVASFNMDQDPGWNMQGNWAWGVPEGQAGENGGPDPTSGHTGTNVLGYNLQGDYENNMGFVHVTSDPINCYGLSQVILRFQRWLGVEVADYDHAELGISTDGVEFHNLWRNSSELTESEWVEVEYDISQWADNNSTVTLRWTMGTTDATETYCGWNIDDVQLLAFGAIEVEPDPKPEDNGQVTILSAVPNPFMDFVTVHYESNSANRVSARVLNLQGAVVADLGSADAEVGENTWAWGGDGDDGRRLPSGLYVMEISSSRDADRIKFIYLH